MTVLLILAVSGAVLILAGRFYARFLARHLGEAPSRPTPAVEKNDGLDYVPTPTPVVFGHHFASIAGAGPILGPVLAIVYGWLPALLWVVVGGVAIGAVHDYLATYMSMREGGQSVATIARRLIGKDAFVAMTLLLILMLALVCAAFLNYSTAALTDTITIGRLELSESTKGLFQTQGDQVVIGGVAFMSVILITAAAPLLGYLYLKRKIAVWKCSVLAMVICAASIAAGIRWPLSLDPMLWKFLLSGYVLLAAGAPVWIFLQSRDFINVHILYAGTAALMVTLVAAGLRGASPADPLAAVNLAEGGRQLGPFWPTMFIVIACGAVSGFHSLCAGGTTCKQIRNEKAARQIGYYAMLLESFLAVCVIAALVVGADRLHYMADVHPAVKTASNPVLGFAMAVGFAAKAAWGTPNAVAYGAIGGILLLGGFLVTTLDTAVRLTRYLIEEVWRAFFGGFDVFAPPVGQKEPPSWGRGELTPVGADGIPVAPPDGGDKAPAFPTATTGLRRWVLLVLRQYWFNSALAVALMLAFALTGAQNALWRIFATSNQLLAAMVLSLASLWLLRRGKGFGFAIVPAALMLVTTITSLVILLREFLQKPADNLPLLIADVLILAITVYLFAAGVAATMRYLRGRGRSPSSVAKP